MFHVESERLIECLGGGEHFLVVDSHTMGEPTRIVIQGFPRVKGNTMMEKKKYIATHFDRYRKTIMLEPRGHANMFGAVLMPPVHAEADIGVIFMDNDGYKNMCGHGSIGVASVLVDEKLVAVQEPYTTMLLDTPAGIVTTKVKVEGGKAKEVTITNVPCFLYRSGIQLELDEFGVVTMDVSFGGNFFALVDADALHLPLTQNNIGRLTKIGMEILRKINEKIPIAHPYLDIHTVDLVEFYGESRDPQANLKNVVIFGTSQIDRCPCGTGTSAKVATLYYKGVLKIGEPFVYEGITGTLFKANILEETIVGEVAAVIPQITGSAYITGINHLFIDPADPLKYGFQINSD